MQVFFNPLQAQHQGRHEMFRGRLVPCVEVPDRVEHVRAELMRRGIGRFAVPTPVDDALLHKLHTPRYLHFLQTAWNDWLTLDPANAAFDLLPSVWPAPGMRRDPLPKELSARVGLFAFDAGSPITAGTWAAARVGADCAVSAAQALVAGEPCAFALTRPPGHHAGADFYGGYCFLNNAALAAQALRDGGLARVAIVDVDYHHGNGTQSLFYERADVLTVSLHGDPHTEYPFYLGHADEQGDGDGSGFNANFPLPAGSGNEAWFAALDAALARLRGYDPELLIVSLGVDTYVGDPIAHFRLDRPEYTRLGQRLAAFGRPTLFAQEGGYATAEIGRNVLAVLRGFDGGGPP